MIALLRLDERLIHGQIVIKWSRQTSIDRILVLNDEAANNELIKKSLMMAAPSSIKTAIRSVDDGLKILNDPRMSDVRALVLVSEIKDLVKVVDNVEGIDNINIGNYGRISQKQGKLHRQGYRSNLFLYDNERNELKELMETGINCTYQTTPEDSKESLEKILNRRI